MSEAATAESVREKVLADSGGRCCMCSAHIGFQVDVVPIVPPTEGGAFATANLAVLCPFCRWLVQRQKVSAAALRNFKKQWQAIARKAPRTHREGPITIEGQPLRLEAVHNGAATVLEGSELSTLLANFFNCLDTFLIHEDQHLENAASLAVIRAFRDMYNYVPPERDIKDLSTADSRKLDLLYRGIRALFSVGLAGSKPRAVRRPPPTKPPDAPKPSAKPVAKGPPARKVAARQPAARKPSARKSAVPKAAKKKTAAPKRIPKK